jgi:hypothetical protein
MTKKKQRTKEREKKTILEKKKCGLSSLSKIKNCI